MKRGILVDRSLKMRVVSMKRGVSVDRRRKKGFVSTEIGGLVDTADKMWRYGCTGDIITVGDVLECGEFL